MNKSSVEIFADATGKRVSWLVSAGDAGISGRSASVYFDFVSDLLDTLSKINLTMADISTIILSSGPGSFTNIRALSTSVNAIRLVYPHIRIFCISSVLAMIVGHSELDSDIEFGLQITKKNFIVSKVSFSPEPKISYEHLVDEYEGLTISVFDEQLSLAASLQKLFLARPEWFSEVRYVSELDYCGEIFSYKKKYA